MVLSLYKSDKSVDVVESLTEGRPQRKDKKDKIEYIHNKLVSECYTTYFYFCVML
jgi:hypothetical protein